MAHYFMRKAFANVFAEESPKGSNSRCRPDGLDVSI